MGKKKRLLVITIAFLLVSVVMYSLSPNKYAYADNIEVIGGQSGLSITPLDTNIFKLEGMNPGDEVSSSIKISNKDSYAFTISLKTERIDSAPSDKDQKDIYDMLQLKVSYKGKTIYEGPINGFGKDSIDLGSYQPNTTDTLTATVYLPGKETGNDYQSKSLQVKWIFTAQSANPGYIPDNPSNPTTPTTIPDNPVPGGSAVTPTPSTAPVPTVGPANPSDNTVPVPSEAVPGGSAKTPNMPKTGETNPIIYYASGAILIILGSAVFLKKKRS